MPLLWIVLAGLGFYLYQKKVEDPLDIGEIDVAAVPPGLPAPREAQLVAPGTGSEDATIRIRSLRGGHRRRAWQSSAPMHADIELDDILVNEPEKMPTK